MATTTASSSSSSSRVVGWIALSVVTLAVLLPWLPLVLYPRDTSDFRHVWQDLLQPNGEDAPTSTTTTLQRHVIVTGANSGLGWGTVWHLAQLPHMHIVLACRSLDRCRVARDELLAASHSTTTLTCAPLDLSLRASVRALVHDHLPRLFSHHNNTTTATSTPFAVDILIDNAGLWSRDDHEAFTQDAGIEIHTAVNHLGHVLLVHLLWPHLQLAPQPARVVSVSSLAAILPRDASAGWYPTGDHHTNNADDADNDPHSSSLLLSFSSYWQTIGHAVQHYARSKRANLMFAAELQDRYASTTNITSVASHPGYTRTNILLSGGSFLPKMVRNWLMENTLASMSATQGAWTQVRAAVDIDNIAGGTHVGPLYWTCGRAVAVANLRARWSTHFWPFTRDESQRLWEQSMEALGITEFGVR